MGLSQIIKMKSDSSFFKDLVRKRKTAVKNWPRKVQQCRGRWKIDLFCCTFCLFFSCYAIIFLNKECPKRLELILLQSFSTLYAKAMRKNCVSVFGFPLVKNLLKRKSCLITPNAPSTWINRFILSKTPCSVVINSWAFLFCSSACEKPEFFCHILMFDIHFCTDSHSFHIDILSDL